MPELQPLNVEASASMHIPPATPKEDKQAWMEKTKELEEECKQFNLYLLKHWNPLDLQFLEKARHEERGLPACSGFTLQLYMFVWHLSRDTSALLCLLAIMGLPWNQPTSDDIFFACYFLLYLLLFTFGLSFDSMPSPGVDGSMFTFFRMLLAVEKARESKATKKRAFFAHAFLLFCYFSAYAWSYIQSSCFEKHYGNQCQLDLTKLKMDRSWNGTEPCRYRYPFPGEPVAVKRSTDVSFWWPALSSDALRPNALSFYIVVLAYFVKVTSILLYDDVYNHSMLPCAEFVRTHYSTIFDKSKEVAIKKR